MAIYFTQLALTGGIGLYLCKKAKFKHSQHLFLILTTASMVIMALLRGPTVGLDFKSVYEPYINIAMTKDLSFIFPLTTCTIRNLGLHFWCL